MGDLNNSFILLADRSSKVWPFAEDIKKYIKTTQEITVPLEEVEIKQFRNGELELHIPENMRRRNVYFIQDSTKDPQRWWVELLLMRDLLLSSSANEVTFVLPDMCYSRQDRKDKSRVPISARALAESIHDGLERIITMDLHAEQIQGMYPAKVPVDNLWGYVLATKHFIKHHSDYLSTLVVVSPDPGSGKRTRSFVKTTKNSENLPADAKIFFGIMDKYRSKPGEIAEINLLGDVEGKDVILPDDIIDSGGTLCSAAEELRKRGATKIACYGTHGLFTEGLDALSEHFDVIITSNTHYQESRGKVEVVDVSPMFAEAIYRAETGRSISKLFE
jgi:ribose-phosphate pyrophosphokinase